MYNLYEQTVPKDPIEKSKKQGLGLWCSTIFQLYRGGQFYWWRNQRNGGKIDTPNRTKQKETHIFIFILS